MAEKSLGPVGGEYTIQQKPSGDDAARHPRSQGRPKAARQAMDHTPTSLLLRLRQPGDHEAWTRLVTLITPLLLGWGHRVGLSRDDADDLAQEVLALLVQKLPEFHYDRTKSFRGWLRQVTLNKWRQRQRRLVPATLAEGDELLDELECPEAEAISDVEYREHLVARAMELMRAEFKPTTWRACWECVVSGRSAKDIGRELGMTVGAVYVAKCRVLARLREELQGLVD